MNMQITCMQLGRIVRNEVRRLTEGPRAKRAAIVKAIVDAAKSVVSKGFMKWEDDLEMIEMFLSDARDMIKVAGSIEIGDMAGAQRLASNMATAARDELPQEFWDLKGDI